MSRRRDALVPQTAPLLGSGAGRYTVDDWKRLRFETTYPDLTVDVVLGNSRVATGKTLLQRVRRSYEEASYGPLWTPSEQSTPFRLFPIAVLYASILHIGRRVSARGSDQRMRPPGRMPQPIQVRW